MDHDHQAAAFLLKPSSAASSMQTFGNIIVSIVGTGILGLPYAFKVSGWLTGSVGVIVVAAATYYCMIILVQCRHHMASEDNSSDLRTYGDLGHRCLGSSGRYITETLILISQCGGATSFLVFIGQNLSTLFKLHGFTSATYVFLLVPLELALSLIKTLSSLAPFSIFADICNVFAMGFVVKDDIQQALSGEFSFSDREAVRSGLQGLPFAGGMAVFCYEGFGLTLTLEDSMKDRTRFPTLLGLAISALTLVYVLFGFVGYMAYGDETKDIVTLNLPRDWTAIAVQVGMCLGLSFTFPITVHPVHEIVEENLKRLSCYGNLHRVDQLSTKLIVHTVRAFMVVLLGILAAAVPGFGLFASLVGSSVCALLSFVLPATFHLLMLGPSLRLWQKLLDGWILISGVVFAVYGTYSTIQEQTSS